MKSSSNQIQGLNFLEVAPNARGGGRTAVSRIAHNAKNRKTS